MSNPFQSAPQAAPTIPDTAAQEFGAPPAQPNAFTPQAPAYDQAAQLAANGQHPVQQAATQAPAAPWSPQQHQAYGQAQGQPGYAPVPQPPHAGGSVQPMPAAPQPTDSADQFAAYARAQQNPAQYATHQQFVQQQAPQAAAPAFASAPAQAPAAPQFGAASFAPQGATPGVPAFAMPGGAIDPSIFNAPAAGGMGRRPGWRDLQNRFVLVRVTARNVERDNYDKSGKEMTIDANIAVLDGGQIVMSPKMGDPNSVAEVFSDKIPCVIDGFIVSSKGMQNRLKTDFTRGRIVREPINDLQKHLKEQPGDEPLWWKLEQWLAQDPSRVHNFKSSIMWSIVEDSSDAANQMTAAFLQTPEGQAFCR
jgi:hypothetical protein